MQSLNRYSMPDAEQALSAALGLDWDSQMQDWDLINANRDLVPRLIDTLGSNELSDDERFALMTLAVASVDELFMTKGTHRGVWEQLELLLCKHPALHAATICYWASPALRKKAGFAVSGRMAKLWRKLEPQLLAAGRGVAAAAQAPVPETPASDRQC